MSEGPLPSSGENTIHARRAGDRDEPRGSAPTLEAEEGRAFYRWGRLFCSTLVDLRARLDGDLDQYLIVGSSRVDLQACKLEYSIVSPK